MNTIVVWDGLWDNLWSIKDVLRKFKLVYGIPFKLHGILVGVNHETLSPERQIMYDLVNFL